MPKKIQAAFLILLAFLLTSCSRTLPNETVTGEILTEIKNETVTEEQTETSDPPPTTEIPITTTVHTHAFLVSSIQQVSCASAGERAWRCSCGETKTEYLPALSHKFSEATCTAPSVCSVCGLEKGARLGHSLQGNTCTRCQKTISAPIYVLGTELPFDATRAEIENALGVPSEVITEGSLVSLVYAADLARLTVIQTDVVGLWGVFTMDPAASFFLDGETVTADGFSGTRDLSSDAYYRDVGSCRIFGFKDSLESGKFYGLWMRYSECRYDYMNDPAIAASYAGQARLSWYYVNALRVKNGISPLLWSDAAAKVATDYSETMALNDFFDHDNSFGQRLKNEGVFWRSAGENISQGYYNLYFVCDAYYNSSGHRKNILQSAFTYVGMGYYQKSTGTVLGAQIFYGF